MTDAEPAQHATDDAAGADAFPRRSARTQRFTLGAPRGFVVSPDGERVLFLRSRHGEDRVTCLWRLDVATGEEHLLVDPRTIADADDERLSPEEQARRERLREGAGGVVALAADRAVSLAAFTLSGALWVCDVTTGETRRLVDDGVLDPRPSPDGRHVAFVHDRALHVVPADGGAPVRLAGPGDDEPDVSWGVAEFVAAEEMGRYRGFWWSPSSDALLVARVDESPVPVWHVGDPANPDRPPRAQRYPAAGTADAEVTLWRVRLDGTTVPVAWDRERFPYLARVGWTARGPALLQVVDRAQQHSQVLVVVDDEDGPRTAVRRELRDDAWVELVPGSPAWTADGRLVTVEAVGAATSLCVDGHPVTGADLQVRSVLHVGDDGVTVTATPTDDPARRLVVQVVPGAEAGAADVQRVTEEGVASATTGGPTTVLVTTDWDRRAKAEVRRGGLVRTVASVAADPGFTPRPLVVRSRVRGILTAVFLPSGHEPGARLPVVMSPYGGPHAQRVLAAHDAHLESQWLADQGFAVVVADGRGTPRTPAWERAVRLDLAGPVLDDQVEALLTAAEHVPDLDLTRVGIRGWSFGGYLAALAVLRRPDVFHAAVAGAPVTDWRLYDTYYTERYLGHPDEHPEAYARSSILDDAPRLTRPLMLVHGLADDNVVAAHTLRLSSALLAAGRPHTVLPLSGVTHMTPQEVVAENLLRLQVEFLREHLRAG